LCALKPDRSNAGFICSMADEFQLVVSMVQEMQPMEVIRSRPDHSDLYAEVAAFVYVMGIGVEMLLRVTSIVSHVSGRSTQESVLANEKLLAAALLIYPDRVPSKLWCAAMCMNIHKIVGSIYKGGDANVISSSVKESNAFPPSRPPPALFEISAHVVPIGFGSNLAHPFRNNNTTYEVSGCAGCHCFWGTSVGN
jgi:hypothetical protein